MGVGSHLMNSRAKAGDDPREIAEPKPAAGSLPQGDGLDAGELALERELEQVIDWLEALAIFRMERLLRDGDRPRAEGDDAPPPTPLPPDQPTCGRPCLGSPPGSPPLVCVREACSQPSGPSIVASPTSGDGSLLRNTPKAHAGCRALPEQQPLDVISHQVVHACSKAAHGRC